MESVIWVLLSTVLVILMVPAVSIFYAGFNLAHQRAMLVQGFGILAAVGALWHIIGYRLAFGGYVPEGVNPVVFEAFQGAFAAVTPALIIGFSARGVPATGRASLQALIFSVIWSLLVYAPICRAVWTPTGILAGFGALDFAGGLVVHVAAGVSALVCARLAGPPMAEWKREPSDSRIALGTMLLWIGWFGFNAGSALAPNEQAITAFLATHLAACTGALAWCLAARNLTVEDICCGAVAGLVAITPAAGYVIGWQALIIGAVAGVVCRLMVPVCKRFADDALDVGAVHGIGGAIGAILTGVFAPAGNVVVQLVSLAVVVAFTALATFGVVTVMRPFVGKVKMIVDSSDSSARMVPRRTG